MFAYRNLYAKNTIKAKTSVFVKSFLLMLDERARRVFGSSDIYMYSILQVIQLESQSGRTRSDSLVKSSPERIKITASIYKHNLCDDGSAVFPGIHVDALMQ